ncbi:hypothetical protein BJ508DRAFT_360433 [Ascobolus immersus RN42]|uniref:Uncharacterized protein n=1 Tax=Ascobolus immersus RN42 TaxID=1160509 RepID=A0A3N4IFJ4_ASCIM|nr:hypothetical protein BJ508DRAFT_360433 [Ascobolus immersus RN42]
MSLSIPGHILANAPSAPLLFRRQNAPSSVKWGGKAPVEDQNGDTETTRFITIPSAEGDGYAIIEGDPAPAEDIPKDVPVRVNIDGSIFEGTAPKEDIPKKNPIRIDENGGIWEGIVEDEENKEPPFHCNVRPDSGQTIMKPPGKQPPPYCLKDSPLYRLANECVWTPGPENVAPWIPRGKSREECAAACKLVYDGTWEKERWKCWEKGCTDANSWRWKKMNQHYIDTEIEFWKKAYCNPLFGGHNGTNGTIPDYYFDGEAGFNETDLTNSTDDTEFVRSEQNESPAAKSPAKKDEDSGAHILTTGKGALLLAAFVGAAFSGFL